MDQNEHHPGRASRRSAGTVRILLKPLFFTSGNRHFAKNWRKGSGGGGGWMRLPAAAGSAGNETWAGDRGGRVFLIPHSLGWLLGRFTVGRRESRYRCHGALHSEFTTVMGWNLPSVGQHPAGSGGRQISRPINQDSWELRCCQLLREGLIVGAERGLGLKGNEGGRGSGDQQMRTVMRTEGQTLKDRRRLVMQRWDLG